MEIDRYEFLVYRLLRNALEAGDVYNMFRTAPGFAASRITSSTMRGGTTKTRCCRSTRRCSSPIEETLPGLRDEIEARFVSVNKRIEDGSNKHIKITGVGAKRR